MYEPMPKMARMTTISVPAEATHRDGQEIPPKTPAQHQPRARTTLPTLPFPPFPNNDNPTPPPSPSLQTTLDPPRLLWTDPNTPAPQTGELTPSQVTPQAALRAIVTTNRDLANLAITTRNTPANPLDKYTNAPMPSVNNAHPTAIFDRIDLSMIDTWDSLPEGKLATIPFGNEVTDISRHDNIQMRIFKVAAEITQGQQVSVSGPGPNTNARESGQPPSTFLIYNLSELQHRTLLERPVWSSSEITFRVVPLMPSRSDFLFSIAGLSTLATESVRDMVNNVWRDVTTLTEIQAITQAINDGIPANNGQEIENFINSLEVKRLDVKEKKGTLAPRFNIYASSKHIQDLSVWGRIRHLLATRLYSSTILGRGITKLAPFNCRVCHGADHPRGLCPFPGIAGWNGPLWRPEGNNNRLGGNRDPANLGWNRQWD